MKMYSIFDDFTDEAVKILEDADIEVTVHPPGVPRPQGNRLKELLETYDGIIIGTGQVLSSDMFEQINTDKIIGTVSVGTDHIHIPENKKNYISVYNSPTANIYSVAEYTIGCMIMCLRRLREGNSLYEKGLTNKKLSQKPTELLGKTIGVVGAGKISEKIMEYANLFGMKVLCWTFRPEKHKDLLEKNVEFTGLDELVSRADILSVNLPASDLTDGLINASLIDKMKRKVVFICVSRASVVDMDYLIKKSKENPDFYLCADIDVEDGIVKEMEDIPNILITPHIAGGTVESRKRMFQETAVNIMKGVTAQR